MIAGVSVSLVIINYNALRYLPDTFAAIAPGDFEAVLFVDNASTDESVAWVREHRPDVQVIVRDSNDGPGASRWTGVQAAPTDRIVCIDADVTLRPGCVAALTRAMDENPRAIIVAPRVIYRARPEICQWDGAGAHCSGQMTIINPDTPVAELSPETRKLDAMVGACFLTDRSLWGDHAMWEPLFFVYYEDHEFSLRARLMGFDLVYVPSAEVWHDDGTPGVSLRETGRFTSVRIRNTILGRWRVLGKLFRLRTLILLSPALALFELFQFAGAIYKGWILDYFRSVGTFVRELPRLWRARRAFQPLRRVRDGEVMKSGPLPFNPHMTKSKVTAVVARILELAFNANWALIRRFV